MFTAPTAIRAIRKEDPNGDFIKQYDLSFKNNFYGERCDLATLEWYNEHIPFQPLTIGGKQNWPIANIQLK
jgi:propionyl-CoA synthetase